MRTPFILIIARPPLHIKKSLIPGLIREISVPRVVHVHRNGIRVGISLTFW